MSVTNDVPVFSCASTRNPALEIQKEPNPFASTVSEDNFKYLNLTSQHGEGVKFHNVLEEVFGTSERVKVLRILARYPKEFTSRELSSYCGVSVRGVIDILTQFERYGFVKSRRVGKAILWKLDEKNYILKSLVRPTFEAEKDLLEHLKRKISELVRKSPVQKAVIYGSVARGEERPDSDIDLLLIVNKKGKWTDELQDKLREEILGLFGNALSIIVCTPDEYKKMGGELKRELENGVAAFGG